MAELGDDQLGGVGVDDLVDRRHDAHAHQRLDDVGAALGHAVRQFLDRDGLGNDHVAHDLDRLLLALMQPQALALAGAPHRGEAAHPLAFIVGERAGDGELAGAAAHLVAAHRSGRLFDLGPGAAAQGRVRLLFLFGRHRHLAGGGECGDLGRRGLAGALGDLAPRLFFLAALRLLLGTLARFLGGAAARLLFLDLAPSLLLGAAAAFLGGALLFLAAAVGLGNARRGAAPPRRPCARPARRARGRRAPRRSARAGSPPVGAPARPAAGGRPVLPHGRPAPLPRACRAPAFPARSCAFCAPRR